MKIGYDTPLYTSHADFVGYHWIDGILGNESAGEYADALLNDPDKKSKLLAYMQEAVDRDEGYYLTEEECQASIDELPYHFFTSKEFTVNDAIREIIRLGAPELPLNRTPLFDDPRSYNRLRAAGIATVGDLLEYSPSKLKASLIQFGTGSLKKVEEALSDMGLYLRRD